MTDSPPPAPEHLPSQVDEAQARIERLERLICLIAQAILLKDYGKDIDRVPLEHLAIQNDLDAADVCSFGVYRMSGSNVQEACREALDEWNM